MSDELPDPLDFVARALDARGALAEPSGGVVVALLPPDLSRALELPESFTAGLGAEEGRVAAGIGSPLIERLAADARRAAPWCAIAPRVDTPRANHAMSMAARVVLRNGVADVLDATHGDAVYARASVAWSVEADDRYEGVVHACASADGGEPDAQLARLLDVASHEGAPSIALTPEDALPALATLPARIAARVGEATGEAIESIERRHARDHERMAGYFAGLIAELGAGRRKVDPATLAAKAQALAAERDARLRDLVVRYTPKLATAPVALVVAKVPAVRVRLRVRRRKAERELRVTLPGGATALDRIRCDGCAGSTLRPALCDDALHALCERCAPQSQGRLACPACGERAG